MDRKIIQKTTELAFEGKIAFPEVIGKLISIGVERYHADLMRMEKTFYREDGLSQTVELPLKDVPEIAREFDAEVVKAAIKMSQQGQIKYPEFLERVMKAGCSHYDVFIDGKQVIYFGRKGDFHIEKFPQK